MPPPLARSSGVSFFIVFSYFLVSFLIQGRPRRGREKPKGGQEEPKESTGSAKEAQVRPKRGARGPRGTQRRAKRGPKGGPGRPKGAQRSPKWLTFCPRLSQKYFPKPSKIMHKSIYNRIWLKKRDFLKNSTAPTREHHF